MIIDSFDDSIDNRINRCFNGFIDMRDMIDRKDKDTMATTKATNPASVEDRSITPKMIAESLNIDAKQLRAHIRSITTNEAGKGGAWRFTASEAAFIAESWTNKRSIRSTAPVFKINE